MFDSALALSVWVTLSLPEIKYIPSRQQQQHWSNSDAVCARMNLGNKVNLIPIVSGARLMGMNCISAELRTPPNTPTVVEQFTLYWNAKTVGINSPQDGKVRADPPAITDREELERWVCL